jgi:tripartite-type tricarboxylate transporter receptor subunit TctC
MTTEPTCAVSSAPAGPGRRPITLAAALVMTAAAALAALPPVPQARAQAFPVKAVRLVHTFPAGGPVDFVTRGAADELSKLWGQPVIVDPRPGGGGSIGSEIVRISPPDGYTLLTGTHSGMVAAPLLNPSVKYHPLKDFTPITQMVNSPFYLIANAQLPANSLKELLALLKAQPGKLNYGSVGQGSSTHLAFEMFAYTAGIQALHVPYKGTAPMIIDLLTGTLQLTFTSIPTVLPHVKTGKLKVIANGSMKRSVAVLDAPTFNEAGLPGFESVTWYGLFAPARLPRAQLKEMNATAVKALANPALLARYTEAGLETIGSTPEQFSRFVGEEYDRWAKLIVQAGIKGN